MATDTTTVHVALSERSYDIEIGPGLLADAGQFVLDRTVFNRTKCSHVVVITDSNVESLHGQSVVNSLEQAGIRVDMATVPAGESTKSASHADQLWRLMLEFGADRKSIVVAVGGGVVGDLAGFIAATYGRGIRFVQIPTTLLAQVDSSVGGKVGINLPGAKNLVGAFWQPAAVLVDTDVLNTLPIRDYRSGLAEVVKYGVILDPEFFEYLEANVDGLNDRDTSVMRHIVARSCELKAEVVAADEREETGLRAVLNYGHTFCHAVEAETGYGTYLHGEAVAIGMLCASRLAESMGRINAEATRRQQELLEALGLPLAVPDVNHDVLIQSMQKDKKTEHGKLRFVLPTRLGHVELVSDVPEELVRAALITS
ncbi:MAG: 3-dehydroquinate synthase [Planctomycetes bacterium]|nr:3-dehydroquinate synthase [Planctomycetota bacterium]